MFPQAQRIHKSADIIFVLRRGVKRTNGVFTCYFLKKPGTLSKVAVIVDTKVSKKAVLRNLLKRRTRAVLRELTLPQGEILVRLWKGAEVLSYAELKSQLNRCLTGLI